MTVWNPEVQDLITLHDGRLMVTHHPKDCLGPYCSIHNPSDHPLRAAPLNWRSDRSLMERICRHGVGHPDPDDIDYKSQTLGSIIVYVYGFAEHGCCPEGCCGASRPK